ncbi:AsmA family protein [Herbaspirillum rhizosphaerae]|uniref:AsmA family protein n=1 Tax=Herbaspirillum rhizosphaerae TaxID=346179 RepID=UPI0009F95B37|nr:AsmA family protein [Herbaspirillum rhizosphaerae]
MRHPIARYILTGLLAILILAAALLLFVAVFDWNLARPFINREVSSLTGRDFAIQGDLKVRFRQGLRTEHGWRRYVPRPLISAGDVHLSNPSWSSAGPQMFVAHRVDIALHPLDLLRKTVVLTDVVLDAPAVALERRADGSNSWTFRQDSSGPSAWSVEVQRLAFSGGTVRYVDGVIALDLQAKISSIADKVDDAQARQAAAAVKAEVQAAAPSGAVQKFGLQFELGGTYRKAKVSGSGKAGAVMTLERDHTVYPIQVQAQLGENEIGVEGTLTDPRSLSGIDLQLTLGGSSMANLYPLTGVLLPETPPYATRGRLLGKKDGDIWNWTYQNFTGTVGSSDLAGTVQYLPRQPRPLLRGEVTSQQLRLQDLGPAVGADSNAQKQARGKAAVQPDDKALPVEQFNTEKWGALDADVTFKGKKLVRSENIPLHDIVAEIHMKDKVLSLTPLNFGMAGGNVTSNISLDGREKNISAQVKLAARRLQVRELFPALQSMSASFGEVNADAALTGHGNSVSAMLGSSNGELGAVVSEGSVSKFILEAAGLNVANAVFAKVFGDKQVHLNCMASDFEVKDGRAGIRQFLVDTDDARVDVTGDIDLARELLNLDVRPKTKGVRIFSLRTPLYARGSFKHPDVGPYKGPLALKAGAAAALAVASPLAALLPLVNMGNVKDADCAGALARATQTRADPKSEPTAAPAKPVTQGEVQKSQQEKKQE